MQPELELYASDELIAELMRRQTFLGVVVHAVDEDRGGPWPEERIFKVHHNNTLDGVRVGRLLGAVAEQLDLQAG